MPEDKIKSPAPILQKPWRINLKWVCGILLVIILGITLLLAAATFVTNEKNGINITTLAIASMFSQNGLDDETEIKKVSRQLSVAHLDTWKPIPGLNISITKKDFDLTTKTPREIRLSFFRQLTEPIYREGTTGLIKLATTPEMKKSMEESAGILTILSAENHQTIRGIFIIFIIISALLLIILSLLSYRSGRLLSPGIVLVIAALPGLLIVLLFYLIEQNDPPTTDAVDKGPLGSYGPLATTLLPLVGQAIRPAFIIPFAVGVVLIFLSIVYVIADKIIIKFKTQKI